MDWRLGIDRDIKSRLREKKAEEQSRWATVGAGLLIIGLLAVFMVFIWGGKVANSDFDGAIVERWADYGETQEGSRPRLRLVVESADGKRFTVNVDPAVYESARVGMRIKSRSGQIVLVDGDGNQRNNR